MQKGDLEEVKTLISDGNGHLIGPSECVRAAMENERLEIVVYLVKRCKGMSVVVHWFLHAKRVTWIW